MYVFPFFYSSETVGFVDISSRFSSNSEADASELPENLEEMFPRYYMVQIFKSHTDMFAVAKGLDDFIYGTFYYHNGT